MTNKKELIFVISGAILLLISIAFVFYSMNFLIIKINSVFDLGLAGNQEFQRINFEGLKKIGIIK